MIINIVGTKISFGACLKSSVLSKLRGQNNCTKKFFSSLNTGFLACELMELIFSPAFMQGLTYDFLFLITNNGSINFIKNLFIADWFVLFNFLEIGTTGVIPDLTINISKFNNKSFIYLTVLDSTSDIYFADFALKHPDLVVKMADGSSQVDLLKYEIYQEKLLIEADRDFWNKLVLKPARFFQTEADLYEFLDWIPFYTNGKFIALVDFQNILLSWYQIMINFLTFEILTFWDDVIARSITTFELKESYYYEPFFFFREKLEKNLDEFRLFCFIRQRALLLEHRVFGQLVWNDQTYELPFLSHYKNKSEFKSALKIYKRLYSYKNNNFFSYYIKFDDIQHFAFDKGYVHLWNYWIGAKHESDFFGEYGFLGFINFLREKVYTPLTQLNSKFYGEEEGYNSISTGLIQFVFFPDTVMVGGDFSVFFDKDIDRFARLFHFGDNYIDRLQALDYSGYQITDNLYGDFEFFIDDYFTYQPAFAAESFAAYRVPIIFLLSGNYESSRQMTITLNDYNSIFPFRSIPEFKFMRAKELFNLTPLQRLEKYGDPITIDAQIGGLERYLALFFGYNLSETSTNYPRWLLEFFTPEHFYGFLNYDWVEDGAFETTFVGILNSLTKYNYDYKINVPIFFQQSNNFFNLNYLLDYFNEKIYDDYGYMNTALTRIDGEKKFEIFSWLGKNSLFYVEIIPTNSYTWRVFIANNFFFEWSLDFAAIVQSFTPTAIDMSLFDPKALNLPQFQTKLCFLTFHLDNLLGDQLIILKKYFFKFILPGAQLMFFFYDVLSFYLFNNLTFPIFDYIEFLKLFIFNLSDRFLLSFLKNIGDTDKLFSGFFSLPYVTYSVSNYNLLEKDFTNVCKAEAFIHGNWLPYDFFGSKRILDYLWANVYDWWGIINYNFFYHHVSIVLVDRILGEHQLHDTYCVAYMGAKYLPLPKSFFVPYLFDFGLTPNFVFIRTLDISKIKFYPFLPDGTLVDLRNINQLRDYFLYAGVLDINNKRNFDYFLQANVHILNKMEWKDITYNSLEYKGYLNYVVKHRCYRET